MDRVTIEFMYRHYDPSGVLQDAMACESLQVLYKMSRASRKRPGRQEWVKGCYLFDGGNIESILEIPVEVK